MCEGKASYKVVFERNKSPNTAFNNGQTLISLVVQKFHCFQRDQVSALSHESTLKSNLTYTWMMLGLGQRCTWSYWLFFSA